MTEEQRRERLRIKHEKDRAKRTKKYKRKKKRSSVTEDNENQRQATLKRLKRGDENELERNVPVSVYCVPVSVYLEKVVASKQLKFAMETDIERKQDWRRWEQPHSSGWPWRRRRKKSKKRNEFNCYQKLFFLSRNELARL